MIIRMPQVRPALACFLFVTLSTIVTAQQAPQPASQVPAPPAAPPASPPAAQTPDPVPAAPATVPVPVTPTLPGTVACPVPVPPATVPARSFTATSGMMFHQVIPARIQDFDRFIAYVRDAFAKTQNPLAQKQAKGWTIHRTVEAGPNGDALYVFVLNPAVPCVDYALGPILAEAYPDPAQLQEIWKLYTGSVRPGGSTLMTLVPAPTVPLTPPVTPPTTPPAGAKPNPVAK